MNNSNASKNVQLDDIPGFTLRELGWLEKTVGPESYRLIRGVFTNPLSVVGLIIVTLFVLTAVFAPVLAPPLRVAGDPYLIPRWL